YIYPIPYEMTIKDFFIKLTTRELSSEYDIDIIDLEAIECIEINKIQVAATIQVSSNCNILEVTTNNVHRTKLYFPNFSQLEKSNRKLNLRDDIVDWIQHHDRGQRMHYIQGLSCAFSFKIGEYRFNIGNNAFNAISIWKINEEANEEKILQENKRIISKLQEDAPCYHTRAIRISYLRTCELLLLKAKLSSLQTIYRMLTSDISAAETMDQAKVNKRVRITLDLRDPEIAEVAAQFLEGKAADAITAVDKCRHDPIVHLETAISVNDLLHQIKKKYPTRILIPNTHYASAIFHYKKEFAPEFPVAAVERGKKVVVSRNTIFAVANHDYTKTGIIPSVTMICNIPESINSDFYAGK
ncbi:11761_t:CDS:2, partial [Scutellospora calospora]